MEYLNIEYLTKGFSNIKNNSGLKIVSSNDYDIEKNVSNKKIEYLNKSQGFKQAYETKLNKAEELV